MFESDADYDRRINQLNALVAKRQEGIHKRYLEDMQRSVGDIQTQIAHLYRRIFPTNDVTVTLGRYDANNEFFPITFQTQSERFNERLYLSKEDAQDLYHNWNKIIKTGYLSIDPGYRRALVMVKLVYTPIWQTGVTWTFREVYHLGSNNIAVAFSANGRYLATGGNNRKAVIWKLSSGEELWQMGLGSSVNAVALSPDGRYLATGNGHYATLWEVNRGTKVWQLEHRYASGLVSVRTDVIGGRKTRTPQMAEGNVYAITFSPDGKYLATGDDTKNPFRHYVEVRNRGKAERAGNANIWEINHGTLVQRIIHETPTGYARVRRNVTSGTKVEYMEVIPGGGVNAVAFSPDGKYLATGSNNVTIWKLSSGQRIQQMEDGGRVYAVSFSPDGKYLATGSSEKASIWEVNSSHRIWQREHKKQAPIRRRRTNRTIFHGGFGHGGSGEAGYGHGTNVAFSSDGQYLAVGGVDRAITLYRIPTNITIETKISREKVIRTSGEVTDLAWNPYGNLISDGKKVYRTLLQPEEVKNVR